MCCRRVRRTSEGLRLGVGSPVGLRFGYSTGRLVWTGKQELCWPNKATNATDALYSGSENGDVIAHIGYAAKLILKTPAIWPGSVGIGNPHGYGATYKARALTYVREMDRSLDTLFLPNFVSTSDSNHYR